MIAWERVARAVWARRVLKVLGIIVLAALGSGLWEYILKPALKSLSFWILDVASFTMQDFRGDVYRQVATSSPTVATIENLNILTLIYSALLALWLVSFFFRITRVPDENRFLQKELKNDLTEDEGHVKNLKHLKEGAEGLGRSIHLTVRSFYVMACLIAVMLTVHAVNFSRIRYINLAIVHYQQTLRIAYPYLSEDDRRRIESEFAQVQTKEAYMRVVGKLESIAKDNGQWVPPFGPW